MLRFAKPIMLFVVLGISGCERVSFGGPIGDPVVIMTEAVPGAGNTRNIAYTDDGRTPTRTTCSDGSLPAEFAAEGDRPETWNKYYVLREGQTRVRLLIDAQSPSGLTRWIIAPEGDFEIASPRSPGQPRDIFINATPDDAFARNLIFLTMVVPPENRGKRQVSTISQSFVTGRSGRGHGRTLTLIYNC